jgi:2-dehydro-3-deoxyphosphogluconate aldolase/(4S)-4-hydroxy-2-oxoglutarate aldolase
VARHKRLDVLNDILETGVVPVFYHADLETAQAVARACVAGGVRALEFTNRGDFALEVFAGLEKFCARELPGAIPGVGSVLDAPTAALYINSGANFVVGPVTNPDVAKLCNRRKVAYVPGCETPSEISFAEELGCEIVKVFPAKAAGGPDFVREVLAPMPWTSVMPTGGLDMTRESLEPWFKAGVVAVGMGSKLISADIVKARDWEGLTRRCQELTALIREIRVGR